MFLFIHFIPSQSFPLPGSLLPPQLVFHFQTLLDNFERTVIDDSRLAGRPAEIFVGKMFKMEVWETLLMSMRTGEVAEFWCDATVSNYRHKDIKLLKEVLISANEGGGDSNRAIFFCSF